MIIKEEMFYIWKDYYHSEDSDEVIARCWNGGPKGWKRKATEYYWSKVQKELLTVGRLRFLHYNMFVTEQKFLFCHRGNSTTT